MLGSRSAPDYPIQGPSLLNVAPLRHATVGHRGGRRQEVVAVGAALLLGEGGGGGHHGHHHDTAREVGQLHLQPPLHPTGHGIMFYELQGRLIRSVRLVGLFLYSGCKRSGIGPGWRRGLLNMLGYSLAHTSHPMKPLIHPIKLPFQLLDLFN